MEPLHGTRTLGDKSTLRGKRCGTCGGDLSDPYPDYATLARTCRDRLPPEALRENAEIGCKFCSIILGVWDDCQEQFDCTLSSYYSYVVEDLDGIKVRIYSVGQNYLLALEPIWMPIPGNTSNPSHWGKVLIYQNDPVLYVALSHCWGETHPLITTTANAPKHEQGIPVEEFPLTFRDAIQTARNFGYSYIWIDSICIIQDNKEDWIRESGLMASVYNGADLVIAASVAAGANEGFLRERVPYREGTVAIGTDPKWSGNTYTYRLVVDPELRSFGTVARNRIARVAGSARPAHTTLPVYAVLTGSCNMNPPMPFTNFGVCGVVGYCIQVSVRAELNIPRRAMERRPDSRPHVVL
ncbi:Heterokaryon incompatibility protein [Apiospora saccharicola]